MAPTGEFSVHTHWAEGVVAVLSGRKQKEQLGR